MRDTDCVAFLQWALPRLRMRWPGFRKVRRQVCKRISRRMRELGLTEAEQYRVFLESHDDEWHTLDACCRVTISRFYRDREVFRHLQEETLPALAVRAKAEGRSEVRCWSAGCGSGEEAYTLALLWRLGSEDEPDGPLSERFPGISLRVTATDADAAVLGRAAEAVYPRGSLKDLPPSWIPAAFDAAKEGFSLQARFREGVFFSLLDIREALPEGAFDLILCRNLVFTYFEEELQAEILTRLLQRLREGGFLVLGGHEGLPSGHWPLEQISPGLPVYRT